VGSEEGHSRELCGGKPKFLCTAMKSKSAWQDDQKPSRFVYSCKVCLLWDVKLVCAPAPRCISKQNASRSRSSYVLSAQKCAQQEKHELNGMYFAHISKIHWVDYYLIINSINEKSEHVTKTSELSCFTSLNYLCVNLGSTFKLADMMP